MTRMPASQDPMVALQQTLSELLRRVEALERQNDLNSASVSGTITFEGSGGIDGGTFSFSRSGFMIPWQSGTDEVSAVLGRVNDRAGAAEGAAAAAMDRANQAYEDQARKPTTSYVDARDRAIQSAADNAMDRANQAYNDQARKPTTSYVDARDAANKARADSAYSLAQSAQDRANSVGSQAAQALQRTASIAVTVNQIIDRVGWKAGSTPPPKITF